MKIILVGKAASGKDYFKDYLIKQGLKVSTSHTSRPMRVGEINGKTYHFTNKFKFLFLALFGYFFEHKKFNGWYYGTSKKEMNDGEVFIFTPSGIKSLKKKFYLNTIIVYFDIDTEVRKRRLLKRSDADTIERRMKADRKDFQNFNTYDIKVNEAQFSCEAVLAMVNHLNIRNK